MADDTQSGEHVYTQEELADPNLLSKIKLGETNKKLGGSDLLTQAEEMQKQYKDSFGILGKASDALDRGSVNAAYGSLAGPAAAIGSGIGGLLTPNQTAGQMAENVGINALPFGKISQELKNSPFLLKLLGQAGLGGASAVGGDAAQQLIDTGQAQSPSPQSAAMGMGLGAASGGLESLLGGLASRYQKFKNSQLQDLQEKIDAHTQKALQETKVGDVMDNGATPLRAKLQDLDGTLAALKSSPQYRSGKLVSQYTIERGRVAQQLKSVEDANAVNLAASPNLPSILQTMRGDKKFNTVAHFAGIDYDKILADRNNITSALEGAVKNSPTSNPAIQRILGDGITQSNVPITEKIFSAPTEDLRSMLDAVGGNKDAADAIKSNFLVSWYQKAYNPQTQKIDFDKMRELVDNDRLRAVLGDKASVAGVTKFLGFVNKLQQTSEGGVPSNLEVLTNSKLGAVLATGVTAAGMMIHNPLLRAAVELGGGSLLALNTRAFGKVISKPEYGEQLLSWMNHGGTVQALRAYPLAKQFLSENTISQKEE